MCAFIFHRKMIFVHTFAKTFSLQPEFVSSSMRNFTLFADLLPYFPFFDKIRQF